MKLLLLIFTISATFANSLIYNIKAPILGTEGKIVVNYNTTSYSYKINASMQTFGLAKKLSGNRSEKYTATGTIKNGKYYAKRFIQDVKYKNKKEYLKYTIDYKTKKITKIRKRWTNNKLTLNDTTNLNFFTYNDLFSIYHNIIVQLKGKSAGWYKVRVAGVEQNSGYLKILIPPKDIQQQEANSLGVKNVWIFHVITNKRILNSKNGELIFAVDNDGIAKAVRVLGIPIVGHLDAYLQ